MLVHIHTLLMFHKTRWAQAGRIVPCPLTSIAHSIHPFSNFIVLHIFTIHKIVAKIPYFRLPFLHLYILLRSCTLPSFDFYALILSIHVYSQSLFTIVLY